MSVTVEPLDAPLGAVLRGVDTRSALSDADFQLIEQALLEHLAIVIADVEDDLDWLLHVGRRFGPLTPHILTRFHHPKTPEMSIITANMDNAESRETARPAGAFWHSDLSYCRDPSDAIFLYATHVPSDGGDTLIANTQRAYEALEHEGLIHSRRGKGFFVSELSEETRKEMAKGRLAENLEPQLKAAIAEGLSRADISDVLSSILNNKKGA